MSEEYDPFAEEVDFDEELEEDQVEQKPGNDTLQKEYAIETLSTTIHSSTDIDSATNKTSEGINPAPECASIFDIGDSVENKIDSVGDDAYSCPRKRPKCENSEHTVTKKSQVPCTEQEKYVRKFLKPYLEQGMVSRDDLDRVAKKLAQKVYEKELAKGTAEITAANAKRVKKYVQGLFERHGRLKKEERSMSPSHC